MTHKSTIQSRALTPSLQLVASEPERPERTVPADQPNHDEVKRVLAHLAVAGQFGRTALVAGQVSLIGQRNNVSLVVAQVELGLMDHLVQQGLVERQGQGEVQVYRLATQGSREAVRQAPDKQQTRPQDRGVLRPKRMVRDQESALSWLARRKDKTGKALITPTALLAGERLQRDFLQAGMNPKMTSQWSGLPMGGSGPRAGDLLQSERQMAAKQRLRRALAACGPELSGVLLDLCCFLKSLEQVEHERGWPLRSGKVALGLGLSMLMRHYGLQEVAVGVTPSKAKQAQASHVWHAPEDEA